MSAADNAAIVAANFQAFNDRKREGTQLSAATSELLDVPTGRKVVGPDGEWEYWQFWYTAFPDGKVDIKSHAAAEDGTVVTEFHGVGTHNGPLTMPDGQQVPATGRHVDIPFCQVAHVKDGKIQGAALYYDAMTMLAQLGLLPQPAATGSSAR